MMKFKAGVDATVSWIQRDWHTNPVRFAVEVWAWAFSIAAAVLFAVTVPSVPFVVYLTITVTNCALYAWASWSRGSFGLLANYVLLTAIDTVALIRAITAA
jgi:hypothetical protein